MLSLCMLLFLGLQILCWVCWVRSWTWNVSLPGIVIILSAYLHPSFIFCLMFVVVFCVCKCRAQLWIVCVTFLAGWESSRGCSWCANRRLKFKSHSTLIQWVSTTVADKIGKLINTALQSSCGSMTNNYIVVCSAKFNVVLFCHRKHIHWAMWLGWWPLSRLHRPFAPHTAASLYHSILLK